MTPPTTPTPTEAERAPLTPIDPTLDPATDASLRATTALFDAILPVMHLPPEPVKVAELDPLMRDLATHYAGGDDGPIREPGDDVPKASDVYTDAELCALLDQHRNSAARMGRYDMAADLNMALDRLSEQSEQLDTARDTVQRLLDEIQDSRDKLSHLGYATCARDVRCLLDAEHAGGCVTSFAEAARIRREDVEADDHDGE